MTKHLLLQDGTELWRRELQAKPHRHDCNLIDVNQDGLRDCIVVGHEGLLTAIDPKTGENSHNYCKELPIWSGTGVASLTSLYRGSKFETSGSR